MRMEALLSARGDQIQAVVSGQSEISSPKMVNVR